jgi:dolichol-phosphate mannosyltransferase
VSVEARTVVVIPTYDEVHTLPTTLAILRRTVPDVDVLVVDDASPDGTGAVADELARDDPAVHVLHRVGERGLGPAYVAGFRWALAQGYATVVEMDADGSHRAVDLPGLLAALEGLDGLEGPAADLVLGSRWVPGGRIENWPRWREVLSRGANRYTRLVTGLPIGDATAGFRAYRASTLRAIDLDAVSSQGYCFQVDMAMRVHAGGGLVREVPITFVERTQGRSKMSRRIVAEALVRVTGWGARRRLEQLRRAVGGRRPGT